MSFDLLPELHSRQRPVAAKEKEALSMQRMRSRRLTTLPVLACLFALTCVAGEAPPPTGPSIGTMAPEFVMRDALTGQEAPLSSQRGKVVVLTFWATWCPSCRQELPILARFQEIVGKDNLSVFAINYRENPESWGALKRLAAKWPIILIDDHKGSIASRYSVSLIPHLFIIDRDGKILANHLGYGKSMNTELVAEVNKALAAPRAAAASDTASITNAPVPE
jgi:thiol-disulfide isomerase/thioredoxin